MFHDNRGRVRDAILEDHPIGSCPNTCDIAVALREGFVYSSAHLLRGATETPNVDKVADLIPYGDNGEPTDFDDWAEWAGSHSLYCHQCGAYAYGGDFGPPDRCDNCGNVFTEAEREKWYDAQD